MTSDKIASASGLERRSPYLARDLIEFSHRLPAEHKISDPAQGERILRTPPRALGLPREVWAGRDKLGFASPVPTWLNSTLASWADAQINTALADAPAAFRPFFEGGARQPVRPHPHAGSHGSRLVFEPDGPGCRVILNCPTSVSACTPTPPWPRSRPPPAAPSRSTKQAAGRRGDTTDGAST